MKLFPFNLTGPHFLWFFIVFGLCVVMIPLYRRRTSPSHDDSPLPHLTDPIEIATLRAGYEEAARLALIVLTDRGLIKQYGKTFRGLPGSADSIREPLELAVFQYFQRGLRPAICSKMGPSATSAEDWKARWSCADCGYRRWNARKSSA
jgi:uncharacterized protein (TIGR04222 family)